MLDSSSGKTSFGQLAFVNRCAKSLYSELDEKLAQTTTLLLNEMGPDGYWPGELSSSALSTAVATIALRQMDVQTGLRSHENFIESGLSWLAANVNSDGGWGDTIRSKSNISTTALCWAAFGACDADRRFSALVQNAAAWLTKRSGSLEQLPQTIVARYGKDRTFSVPILMTLALSGRLGPRGWRHVLGLPFELAVLPRRFYGAIRLPVVSYALPALIAIGQAIHHHAPSRNPVLRVFRNLSRNRTLKLLSELQPENGGFLEATPLTAFVTMSLASAGNHNHIVAQKAASFLRHSIREDGSWPIDTNLATWVTTLSIKALSHQEGALSTLEKGTLTAWLSKQQTQSIHPYTGAAPGAWAWTDLLGGVPDADDTAGALLALHHLDQTGSGTVRVAEAGITWLLNLANRDGGIPTFCPGWGTLPFDRSTPEITAHALRAWKIWRPCVNPSLQSRIDRAAEKAMRFLQANQQSDGSFIPLWFGNETAADENNPVYGTAQVLITLNEIGSSSQVTVTANNGRPFPPTDELLKNAAQFLASAQNSSGGWGGDKNAPDSIEETALALEALRDFPEFHHSVESGTVRLLEMLDSQEWMRPAPIGLYFARLWYFERLYPLIFSVSALGKLRSKQR